jgi:alkaline phosphatase D
VREHGITGFATIAGDRHSFWAGLAVKSLPPDPSDAAGIAFVVGSISAPGLVEALEHVFPKEHPLRPLFVGQSPADTKPQPTVNLLVRHGVRSCLEYAKSGDLDKAHALSNRALSPDLSFVDMGGHGYAVVRASKDAFETEFVCIPRPLERSETADGGPLRYRALCRAELWQSTEAPKLSTRIIEGDARFSIG